VLRWWLGAGLAAAPVAVGFAQETRATQPMPPLVPGVETLFLLSDAQSRSISPENPTGGKGMGARAEVAEGSAGAAAAKLGRGWKVNPYLDIEPGTTLTLGEAQGPGVIHHVWMTLGLEADYRSAILRFYWDGESSPSVECPAGDFFAAGWGRGNEPVIDSAVVIVNPGSGFNSFWQMPFRERFRLTMENRSPKRLRIYYQIDYSLTEVPPNAAYFHAQFREVRRLPAKEAYTILDGVRGQGHYVGTYLGHGARSPGWWGEGEVKFYLDGDEEFPTIAGTGEEDYFLGSYAYIKRGADGAPREVSYSSAYAGFYSLDSPSQSSPASWAADYFRDGVLRRHGEYRWHVVDPIRFSRDIAVTIQSLGWTGASAQSVIGDGTYLPLQDHLASVAYWYQVEPHQPFPALPSDEQLALAPATP
jgi:hypothetical protein